jgi:hypothetical protein
MLLFIVVIASAASVSGALHVNQASARAKFAPPRVTQGLASMHGGSLEQQSSRSFAVRTAEATGAIEAGDRVGSLSTGLGLLTGQGESDEEDSNESQPDEPPSDTHDIDVVRGLIEIPAGAFAAWLEYESSRLTSIILSPEPRPARTPAPRST